MGKAKGSKHHFRVLEKKPTLNIPETQKLVERIPYYAEKPKFCFHNYEHQHRRFSATVITNYKDFHAFFGKIKVLSQLTWQEIKRDNKNHHMHEIDNWNETNCPNGFEHIPEAINYPALQFGITDKFRIHGYMKEKIFHVVWFDPNHYVFKNK